MKEEWRDIKDFEGWYQVSNLGRVRSVDRIIESKNGRKRFCKGKILKPFPNKDGYLNFHLHKNDINKTLLAHRLVAQAFIPNDDIENKKEINHVNAIKFDNRVSNLSWCNRSENMYHASKMNLISDRKGEKNSNAKLSKKQVMNIRKEYKPHNQKYGVVALAKKYSVSSSTIQRILRNESHFDKKFNKLSGRFTAEQIKQIRNEYKFRDAQKNYIELSKRYGVSINAIFNIIHRKTYKNID